MGVLLPAWITRRHRLLPAAPRPQHRPPSRPPPARQPPRRHPARLPQDRTRWGDSVEVREAPRTRPCPSCGWSSSAATAVQTRFSTCSPVTGVTLDIGRGMRDEVDDRESGWARQVDESVTQIVEHGYFRLRAKAADHGNARACCPTRDRLRPRPFAQLGPPLPRTRRAPSGHRAWADLGSAQRVPRCPAPSASGRQCRCEVSACVPPSLGGTLLVSHSGGGTSTPDSDTWTPSDIRCSNAHATTGLQHQLHLGPQVLLVHPLMVPAPARARH